MSLNKSDIINATTNVAGVEIRNNELAEWLWKSVQYLSEQKAGHQEQIAFLDERIKKILVVHFCLLGSDIKSAEEAADKFVNFNKVLR